MDINTIIKELNNQVASNFNDFKGSYLYGSWAKGTQKNDSDIDVVILFDSLNRKKEFEICSIVGSIENKYNIFIDLQTFTPDKLKLNPFYYEEVTQKGIFYAV